MDKTGRITKFKEFQIGGIYIREERRQPDQGPFRLIDINIVNRFVTMEPLDGGKPRRFYDALFRFRPTVSPDAYEPARPKMRKGRRLQPGNVP